MYKFTATIISLQSVLEIAVKKHKPQFSLEMHFEQYKQMLARNWKNCNNNMSD